MIAGYHAKAYIKQTSNKLTIIALPTYQLHHLQKPRSTRRYSFDGLLPLVTVQKSTCHEVVGEVNKVGPGAKQN